MSPSEQRFVRGGAFLRRGLTNEVKSGPAQRGKKRTQRKNPNKKKRLQKDSGGSTNPRRREDPRTKMTEKNYRARAWSLGRKKAGKGKKWQRCRGIDLHAKGKVHGNRQNLPIS